MHPLSSLAVRVVLLAGVSSCYGLRNPVILLTPAHQQRFDEGVAIDLRAIVTNWHLADPSCDAQDAADNPSCAPLLDLRESLSLQVVRYAGADDDSAFQRAVSVDRFGTISADLGLLEPGWYELYLSYCVPPTWSYPGCEVGHLVSSFEVKAAEVADEDTEETPGTDAAETDETDAAETDETDAKETDETDAKETDETDVAETDPGPT